MCWDACVEPPKDLKEEVSNPGLSDPIRPGLQTADERICLILASEACAKYV